jgi:YesN/AraC family two-component response regulator
MPTFRVTDAMKLYIKNMISSRCRTLVEDELKKVGISHAHVRLGSAEVLEEMSPVQLDQLQKALATSGLEVIDNKRAILIEKIRNVVVHLVHNTEAGLKTNFSVYLSEKLGYDYTYLANIFSEAEGISIEKFLIAHKIERVKELIEYDELNLTEIASKLHYSSVSHLSNQFKKTTGQTPSHFRRTTGSKRSHLENV